MRIHFMINGLGLGHLYRSLPLIKEMERRGHEISISSFNKSYELLLLEGYNVDELPPIGELISSEDKIEVGKSLIENIKRLKPTAFKKITDIFSKHKPDILVVDGYILGVFFSKMYSIPTVSIVNCTKLSYVFKHIPSLIEFGSDTLSKVVVDLSSELIVPDFEPPFCITENNLDFFKNEKKFNFVGPLDIVKPKKKTKNVLITMGGSDLQDCNMDVLTSILKKKGYSVTLGSGGLMNKEKVNDAIANAPFIVTHGGHSSIMSCISANTGMILIPLKDYTERVNNSIGVVNQGLGVMLDTNFLDEITLELAIESVTSKKCKENLNKFSSVDYSQNVSKACDVIEKNFPKNRNE